MNFLNLWVHIKFEISVFTKVTRARALDKKGR